VSVACIAEALERCHKRIVQSAVKGNTTRKVPPSKLRGITRVAPGIYRWPLVQCTLTSLVAFPTTGDTRFSANDSNNMHVFGTPGPHKKKPRSIHEGTRNGCGNLGPQKTVAEATTRKIWCSKVLRPTHQMLTLHLYPLHPDLNIRMELKDAEGMATPNVHER